MSRKKVRNLSAVFFVGLFILSSEPVFLWLLAGTLVLLHPEEGGGELEKTRKNLIFQIGNDARKYGLKIPRKVSLRNLLVQVYQNFEKSKKDYPHLKAEYKDVLSEMWKSLALEQDSDHWNRVISSVLAGWPRQKKSGSGSVQSKLKKVTELTQQWDDAKKEVYGGVSV